MPLPCLKPRFLAYSWVDYQHCFGWSIYKHLNSDVRLSLQSLPKLAISIRYLSIIIYRCDIVVGIHIVQSTKVDGAFPLQTRSKNCSLVVRTSITTAPLHARSARHSSRILPQVVFANLISRFKLWGIVSQSNEYNLPGSRRHGSSVSATPDSPSLARSCIYIFLQCRIQRSCPTE